MSVHKGDIPLYSHPAPAPAEPESVPDVAGLIAEISKRPLLRPTSEILAEAATALAALQSQNAQQAERIKELEVEKQALKNALWRACGDDADAANEYLDLERTK